MLVASGVYLPFPPDHELCKGIYLVTGIVIYNYILSAQYSAWNRVNMKSVSWMDDG